MKNTNSSKTIATHNWTYINIRSKKLTNVDTDTATDVLTMHTSHAYKTNKINEV